MDLVLELGRDRRFVVYPAKRRAGVGTVMSCDLGTGRVGVYILTGYGAEWPRVGTIAAAAVPTDPVYPIRPHLRRTPGSHISEHA